MAACSAAPSPGRYARRVRSSAVTERGANRGGAGMEVSFHHIGPAAKPLRPAHTSWYMANSLLFYTVDMRLSLTPESNSDGHQAKLA